MKHFKVAGLLALALMFAACGSNSNSNNGSINGNWTATLLDTKNNPTFSFTTALTSSGSNGLVIANFSLSTKSPCFASGETESGGFTLGGNFNGNTSGTFTLNIQSNNTGTVGSNTLVLQGTVNNNTISGNWNLTGTGAGCVGSGTFTMVKG
jgi:hypothetical protein